MKDIFIQVQKQTCYPSPSDDDGDVTHLLTWDKGITMSVPNKVRLIYGASYPNDVPSANPLFVARNPRYIFT